jgi:hypothetical protein
MPQKRQEADETFGTDSLAEELVCWFTQHGGHLSTDVHIAHTQSRGFHLQALKPLNSPVVVKCPLKLTLSCLNLDPRHQEVLHIDSPLQQCRGKIPDHILTYLVLIEQQKKAMACLHPLLTGIGEYDHAALVRRRRLGFFGGY